MSDWKFGVEPEPYGVRFREAKFAVVLVMAGDGDLGPQLYSDFYEMCQAVSEDVAVLALVDRPGDGVARVTQMLPQMADPVFNLEEICKGDPRPLADFLARALVSFTPETRFAIGFWGHGTGAFGDLDHEEIVLRRELRFGELGGPIVAEGALVERATRVPRALFRSMLPDMTSENVLTNREASSALTVAFSRAGRSEPVDILFFDTCLNGSVEVFAELRGFAKAFVASSIPIPGSGWRYDTWLKMTAEAMPKTPEKWAELAVKSYEEAYDQRVCEDPAHLVATSTGVDFLEPLGRLFRALVERGVPACREVTATK